MTRDEVTQLAKEVGAEISAYINYHYDEAVVVFYKDQLERFAALVAAHERNRKWTQAHWTEYERSIAAAEREKVAAWMIERDYATGNGDTIEGLLKALEWQAKERARGFL